MIEAYKSLQQLFRRRDDHESDHPFNFKLPKVFRIMKGETDLYEIPDSIIKESIPIDIDSLKERFLKFKKEQDALKLNLQLEVEIPEPWIINKQYVSP
jgi:hypothetical protein